MHPRRPSINQTFVLRGGLKPRVRRVCRWRLQSMHRAWGLGGGTHGAELPGRDDDAPLVQHAGEELQHVVHVHGHEVLREVPLHGQRQPREVRGQRQQPPRATRVRRMLVKITNK